MWPWQSNVIHVDECGRRIGDLKDNFGEERASLYQRIGELEGQVEKMRRPLTEDGLNSIAAEVATMIDNTFVRAFVSPAERTKAVHIIVREAIREATEGGKHWNASALTTMIAQASHSH